VPISSSQYFYTIKELREVVLPMSKLDLNCLEDDNDDRVEVGGGLVTQRAIVRSNKCTFHPPTSWAYTNTNLIVIAQLAEPFFNLKLCEPSADTPMLELAKLPLITSRDEEGDKGNKCSTDSSNDTDAKLVEDAPSRVPMSEMSPPSPHPPPHTPNFALGKQVRDIQLKLNAMVLFRFLRHEIPACRHP
jgi:ubiquitin carboxyl-terminal hydrolase 25/28